MANDSANRTFDLSMMESENTYLKTLFELEERRRETCIPAQVVGYDRARRMVTVRPLANHKKTTMSGLVAYRRDVVTVPVYGICCGGFRIDIPLFVGDTGYLIAADRNCAVGVIGKNAVALRKDQEEGDQEGSLADLEQSVKTQILKGGYAGKKNEGPQNCDSARTTCYANGFFLPCSWSRSGLANDAGLVIGYLPPEDEEKTEMTVRLSKGGVSFMRGEMRDGAFVSEEEGVEVSVGDDEVKVRRNKDTIKLTDEGLKYEGEPDRTHEVLTNLRYDLATHQIQKKTVEHKVRGDFVVGVGEESDWKAIDGGQAVPEQTSNGN